MDATGKSKEFGGRFAIRLDRATQTVFIDKDSDVPMSVAEICENLVSLWAELYGIDDLKIVEIVDGEGTVTIFDVSLHTKGGIFEVIRDEHLPNGYTDDVVGP